MKFLLEFLLVSSLVLGLTLTIVFFIFQWAERDRTPLEVFIGPINRKEFKILLSIIENDPNLKSDTFLNENYESANYRIRKDFITDKWTVNGVNLSVVQERKLIRAIARNKLKANTLTKAGQVLYGG